jgi:hypothetical protein
MSRVKALALAVFLVALVAAVAVPVYAGVGRDTNMTIGRANGALAYNTSLYSTNNTATLSLYNKNGSTGAPALRLHSNIGPALEITSSDRIPNLNADLVDGLSADSLARAGWCVTDNATDGETTFDCTITIDAPASGWLTLSGSTWVNNQTGTTYEVTCSFRDGDTTLTGSTRITQVVGYTEDVCASHAVLQVPAGTETVDFRVVVPNVLVNIDDVAAHATFVTHDGSGNRP